MVLKYTVILLPEVVGGYSIICPALPGCASQGETLPEAIANIQEAAEGWLESWVKSGNAIPSETAEIVGEEAKQCLIDRELDGFPLILETRLVEIHQSATV